MKKFKSLLVLAFFTVLALSPSCKKDKVAPIEGTWIGTYYIQGPNVSANITFNFGPNQTLSVVNGGTNNTSNGTWTLAGQNFEAKWNEVINATTLYHTFKATVNLQATTFTNGTWSQNDKPDGQFVSMGIWMMSKK